MLSSVAKVDEQQEFCGPEMIGIPKVMTALEPKPTAPPRLPEAKVPTPGQTETRPKNSMAYQ